MSITGSELVAATLERLGVESFFFLMGAPMLGAEKASIERGIQGIDVRHEQAAAMMAQAYSRVRNQPGVCMACSGPGVINFGTGLANALVDCAPVVALGGSGPIGEYQTGGFQEFDQVAAMRPLTKWADRVYQTERIPEMIALAFRTALSGKPGPVYLDLPGDVLYRSVEESDVRWPSNEKVFARPKPHGDPALVKSAIAALQNAKRPIVISGSGVIWSNGQEALQQWVEKTGLPLYTTPQGRGAVPEDHDTTFLNARSTALKEADFVLVVGTRLNYVFGHGLPPRFNVDATLVRIDVDPMEIGCNDRVDIGIVGDAAAVLQQLMAEAGTGIHPDLYSDWTARLRAIELKKRPEQEERISTDQTPIHPLRLCKEVRDFMDRDAILVVDGQEILNYGRQTIPTYRLGHRLNSGPFGTMGVGLPFGIGAKAAKPEAQVIVLHGDGSFGMNGMELDTALRHNLPVLVVISLNGGWTADPQSEKPGRELGYTRYDELAKSLGCHGEFVERPEDIRPALERAEQAVRSGKPAVVNVVTDFKARAATVKFAASST
jgi:thiamine pyrophosphate-dependent acetolactate synthase large subunit-like protein